MGPKRDDGTLAKAKVEKALKLLALAEELHAKQFDVMEEIKRLLAGEATIGDKMREVSDGFSALWRERHDDKYRWDGAKDSSACKRLLREFDPNEVLARAQRYLVDGDPFYAKAGYSFSLFAMKFNAFADRRATAAPVFGCTHTPACSSDVEHTQRRAQERAS